MTSGEHESSRLPRIDFCQVGQKVPLWGIIDEYHCLGVVMNRRLMALALLFILSLTCSALAGVPYTLEGILTVHSDAITLNTADGRVFSLEWIREKPGASTDSTFASKAMPSRPTRCHG